MSTPIVHSAVKPAEHAVRPVLLSLADGAERAILQALLDDPDVRVFDTLESQLGELVQTRRPERKLSADELAGGVNQLLGDRPAAEYGTWAHYPWSNRLVHLLPAEEFAELRTSRNRYLITATEQALLLGKRVGIVGLSVGQSVAFAVALERGAGELRLADFDTLELSNLNRLRGGVHDLGLPKVVLAAQAIAELDPYLKVVTFAEGLTEATADSFFTEGGKLDLVVDECDGLDMKVRLREKARDLGIAVIMQTSDRGMLDIERFDLEPARPFFHGLAGDLRAADLVGLSNEDKVPPLMKIIGVEGLSTRIRASLLEVERSIRTWPQLGSAVTLGGGLAADAVRRVLLGQLRESGRFYVDLAQLVSDPSLAPSPFGRGMTPLREGLDNQERRHLSLEGGGMTPLREELDNRERMTPLREELDNRERRHPSPEGGGTEGGVITRACLAPSAGNHQPWRWIAKGQKLELHRAPGNPSPLTDFDGLATAVSLGAAIESLVLAAHAEGVEVKLDISNAEDSDLVATFELRPSTGPLEGHDFDSLESQLELRHTDRRLGAHSPLALETQELLHAAARSVEGVELRLVTDRDGIEALARLIGQGDRLRMLDPGLSREMFAELRWSRAEAEQTGDGLEVESLHLSAVDRTGLELCRSPEALALVAAWGLGTALERLGQKWASASSALGLLTVKPADRRGYLDAGRAVQRLWLTATRAGLALHPLTFLPYAFARLLRGGKPGLAPTTLLGLGELRPAYAQLLELDGSEGEVLLFRVFPAQGPTSASVRRSVDRILQVQSAASVIRI